MTRATILVLLGIVPALMLMAVPAHSVALPVVTAAAVNPLIGSAHGGNTFPGATLPFGMLQWSPENTMGQHTHVAAPGGYRYDATRIRGFSLTHLSGTGCRGASGDIPFMPVTVPITTSPSADDDDSRYASDFSHADEHAIAGDYRVTLANGIGVELTAALRSGMARFAFPAGKSANLLLRVSDSEVGSSAAEVHVDKAGRAITGSVTSGNFCGYLDPAGQRSYYTLYFVAEFDRPFARVGSWHDAGVQAGSAAASGGTSYGDKGFPPPARGSGAWVGFDATDGVTVDVRVGISYVNVANARANLAAEIPSGTSLDKVRARALDAWNDALGRIAIEGGTPDQRTTFYTALYHALLQPTVYSDVNGQYRGFDQKTHRVEDRQNIQYANFSGWDIYRSQLQLITWLMPERGSDIAQSLFNQAGQNHGEWDRWTHNSGGTHVMNGDPAAPALAAIVAFGGRDFDLPGAYASLVKAATVPTAHDLSSVGCEVECVGQRPSLDHWLTLHYIATHSNSWGGAAETLESASADFALSELARRLGKEADRQRFLARSGYWRNLFNPDAAPDGGYIQNRNADGTWPVFTPSTEDGFVEGSAAQYLWMIPFDVHGLFDALGGRAKATARLDAFFHKSDGSWALSGAGPLHAELDNEPSIASPWLYDYAGQPWKTQKAVRIVVDTLWKNAPDGIPGNDDLGEMSSWYVWAALGMYPMIPGRAELVLGSPLFAKAIVHRAGGDAIIEARGAASDVPYVHALTLNGNVHSRPWLDAAFAQRGGTLDYTLAAKPDRNWGAGADAAPPSFPPDAVTIQEPARPSAATGSDGAVPEKGAAPVDSVAMAARVRTEFLHAWNNYKRYAWGHDDLRPLSRKPHDWYGKSLLMTPVDALDTLVLMGLTKEADADRELIAATLDFDQDISVKNFEVTIRLLGGLLSGYQLTGDARLLHKAEDLGRRLAPVFDSPTGLPYVNVNLRTGKTSGVVSNPAETGTLLLEFGTLSKLTGNAVYYEKAKRALVETFKRRSKIGLLGVGLNVRTGAWTDPDASISGGIDSFYEYLWKCWRLFGDPDCHAMWNAAITPVNRYLADEVGGQLWYGHADMDSGRRTATEYGALDAFFPAVLAMSGDVQRAARLQDSSFRMWKLHGIEPEVLDYRTLKLPYPGYALRPEIVESTYYLYHYTHDPKYLAMGRTMFDDFVKYCRTDAGYAALKNVITKEKRDDMESFLFAETFKYYYLLFDPKALDFDAVTFNTEAHALRPVVAAGAH
ncbi:MAG: GH92 family glycosyl hydrolase [Rhodanobacteraceae bacterium]